MVSHFSCILHETWSKVEFGNVTNAIYSLRMKLKLFYMCQHIFIPYIICSAAHFSLGLCNAEFLPKNPLLHVW
jgi:hypothetical protein